MEIFAISPASSKPLWILTINVVPLEQRLLVMRRLAATKSQSFPEDGKSLFIKDCRLLRLLVNRKLK